MHISVAVSKILTRQYQNANTESDTPIAKLTRLGRVWRPYLKACCLFLWFQLGLAAAFKERECV